MNKHVKRVVAIVVVALAVFVSPQVDWSASQATPSVALFQTNDPGGGGGSCGGCGG